MASGNHTEQTEYITIRAERSKRQCCARWSPFRNESMPVSSCWYPFSFQLVKQFPGVFFGAKKEQRQWGKEELFTEQFLCVRLFATPWTVWFMKFSCQNTGVGSLSLLQGIFPTQGLNPGLPRRRQIPASPVAQLVKNPPAMQGTWVRSLARELNPAAAAKTQHSQIKINIF